MDKQQILKEDLSGDFELNDEDISLYAKQIGIDVAKESHLLWIAKEGLTSPLPAFWCPVEDSKGRIYFYNTQTEETKWEHPSDAYYREKVEQERLNYKIQSNSIYKDNKQSNIEGIKIDIHHQDVDSSQDYGNKYIKSESLIKLQSSWQPTRSSDISIQTEIFTSESKELTDNLKRNLHKSLSNLDRNIIELKKELKEISKKWEKQETTSIQKNTKSFLTDKVEKIKEENCIWKNDLASTILTTLIRQENKLDSILQILKENSHQDNIPDLNLQQLKLHKRLHEYEQNTIQDINMKMENLESKFYDHLDMFEKKCDSILSNISFIKANDNYDNDFPMSSLFTKESKNDNCRSKKNENNPVYQSINNSTEVIYSENDCLKHRILSLNQKIREAEKVSFNRKLQRNNP